MSRGVTLVLTAFLFIACTAMAQAPAAEERPTISKVLDRGVSSTERQFVGAAEAMPEDRFEFAPDPANGDFKGVRTFGAQIRHVAVANMIIASTVLGEKPAYTVEDAVKGPAGVKTRAETLKLLKDSFAAAHRAAAAISDANATEMVAGPFGKATRLGILAMLSSHAMDHYGQMVVYLRMNGVVPPASRNQ